MVLPAGVRRISVVTLVQISPSLTIRPSAINLSTASLASSGGIPRVLATHLASATQLFIYEIDVLPEARQRGIATTLIEELKNLCRSHQLQGMFVFTNESNEAAMRLYKTTGGVRPNPDDVLFGYE